MNNTALIHFFLQRARTRVGIEQLVRERSSVATRNLTEDWLDEIFEIHILES